MRPIKSHPDTRLAATLRADHPDFARTAGQLEDFLTCATDNGWHVLRDNKRSLFLRRQDDTVGIRQLDRGSSILSVCLRKRDLVAGVWFASPYAPIDQIAATVLGW